MKDNVFTTAAIVVLFGVAGIGFLLAPSLQDDQRSADAQASRSVEAGRRELAAYSANLDRVAQLRDDLAPRVDLDVADAARAERDEFLAFYEDERDALAEAFGLTGDRRPSGPPMTQIREGIAAAKEFIVENEDRLKEAMRNAEAALSVQEGDASTAGHGGANRLKGLVLRAQGQAAARWAADVRTRAVPLETRILSLADQAQVIAAQTRLVAESGIEKNIAALTEELAQRIKSADAARAELSTLDERIATMERELAQAQAAAAAAREKMETLEQRGIDFSDPRGFEKFEQAHNAAAADYRSALKAAHAVEHGTLPKAELDASGDPLHGRYLENGSDQSRTPAMGLDYYRAERIRLAEGVRHGDDSVEMARGDLQRMKDTLADYQRRQQASTEQLAAVRSQALETYKAVAELAARAAEFEDQAVEKFSQASGAYEKAERWVAEWVSEAGERVRALGPEAEARSAFKARLDDGDIAGHCASERAAAETEQAWVHYQRYQALTSAATWIEGLGPTLGLPVEEAAALRESAQLAKTAGVECVSKALDILEKKSYESLRRNWTVAAQYAGSAYLLVLFGEPARLGDVIANYRNAVAGAGDDPSTKPIRDRLAALEKG